MNLHSAAIVAVDELSSPLMTPEQKVAFLEALLQKVWNEAVQQCGDAFDKHLARMDAARSLVPQTDWSDIPGR